MDERLSWPGCLTHRGHFTHEVVTCQPQIRHRSGKVRHGCQPKTDVLATKAHQQIYCAFKSMLHFKKLTLIRKLKMLRAVDMQNGTITITTMIGQSQIKSLTQIQNLSKNRPERGRWPPHLWAWAIRHLLTLYFVYRKTDYADIFPFCQL